MQQQVLSKNVYLFLSIFRDSNGNIPISAACNIPIIGTGTRLNEYRSGQDVDKMARSVVVVDMLINNVRKKTILTFFSKLNSFRAHF